MNPKQQTALLTYPIRPVDPLKDKLEQLGFKILHYPLIRIEYQSAVFPEETPGKWLIPDWIFFTSRHGVYGFLENLSRQPSRMQQDINNCAIAAVGEKTAKSLQQSGRQAKFVSPVFDALSAAEHFSKQYNCLNQNIWWPCGTLANPDFKQTLRQHGATVHSLTVYKTHLTTQGLAQLSTPVDWIVFTSSSAVEAFKDSPAWPLLENQPCQFASIGSKTTDSIITLLKRVPIQPQTYTFEALAKTIEESHQQ